MDTHTTKTKPSTMGVGAGELESLKRAMGEIYLALGTQEADCTKWAEQIRVMREESWRADAAEARATRLAAALRRLIERHEEEVDGGAPISGEEWEIASYTLPRIETAAEHWP